jgi:hypothetical protein
MAKFTPEEAQAIVNRYNAALASGRPVTAALAKDMRDAATGIKDYSDSLHKKVNELKDAVIGVAKKLADGEEGLSVYSEATEAGGNALGAWAEKLPILGGAAKKLAESAGKYFAAAQKQGDEVFKNYRSMSQSGLVVGMTDTFANMQSAGYTMKEIGNFTNLMKTNATTLATFGGTAADGAKGFVEISRTLNTSQLMEQFGNMGMSIDNVNESSMNYMKFQQLSGSTKARTTKELAEGTRDYIEQQDRLSKLTGLNAEQQNAAYEKRLRMEQFNYNQQQLQRKINQGGAEGKEAELEYNRNREIMSMMEGAGADAQSDGLAMLLSGAVNDPRYQQAALAFPQAHAAILAGEKSSSVLFGKMTSDAKKLADEGGTNLASMGTFNKTYGDFGATAKLAGLAGKDMVAVSAEATATQNKQKTSAADPSTARYTKMKNNQRNTTQTADLFINKGVGPAVAALNKIAGVTQQVAGVAGQVAGKEGQMGGGTTLVDKTRGIVGAGKSSGSGDENARVMPGRSTGSDINTRDMSRNATATTATTATAPMVAATTAAATAAPIAATTAAATAAPIAATASTAASNATTNTREMQLSQGQAEIKAGIPAGYTAASSAFARQSTEKPNSNKQNGPVWFVNPFKVISNELSRAGILQSNYTTTTAKTSKEQLANQQSIQSESDKSLEINSAKLNSITELTNRLVSKGINPTQKSFSMLSDMLELRSTGGSDSDMSSKLGGTSSLLSRSKALLNNMVSSGGSSGSSGGSSGSSGGSSGSSSSGASEGTPSGSPGGNAANAMKLNAGGSGSVAGGTAETEKSGGLAEGTGPTDRKSVV